MIDSFCASNRASVSSACFSSIRCAASFLTSVPRTHVTTSPKTNATKQRRHSLARRDQVGSSVLGVLPTLQDEALQLCRGISGHIKQNSQCRDESSHGE